MQCVLQIFVCSPRYGVYGLLSFTQAPLLHFVFTARPRKWALLRDCEISQYPFWLQGWTPSSIQIINNINSPLSQWSNWHRLQIFFSIGWEIARRDLQTSRQAWEHAIGKWEYSGKVQWKLQIQDARNNAFCSGGVWQDPAGLVPQLRGEGQVRWRDGQAQRRTWESAGETLRDTVFRFFSSFHVTQGAAGKYQIAQEKTQLELDKAHQEIDILREKMERNTGESRRVSFNQRRRSTSLWFSIWKMIGDDHGWSSVIIWWINQRSPFPSPTYIWLSFSIINWRHIVEFSFHLISLVR